VVFTISTATACVIRAKPDRGRDDHTEHGAHGCDGGGRLYRFNDLPAGVDYVVTETDPSGYTSTTPTPNCDCGGKHNASANFGDRASAPWWIWRSRSSQRAFRVGRTGLLFAGAEHRLSRHLRAITVTDTLPTGLSLASANGSGWSCSAAGSTLTCANSGPLAPEPQSHHTHRQCGSAATPP